ncbi:GPW/gp25 family protein [Fodinicurvata sp. EGI_FJ10296]|uniref:GPW/gp25 family protein n=1 Tax=Fodinicurvata sp. EGI_FJ10296 TaxID=3231908 RepID=UPI0034550D72
MQGMDAITGEPLAGTDHLAQSIRDILTTRVGTRVMRREYGSDLPRLVDAPLTPATVVDFYAATAKALRRWEPRLRLTRVQAVAGSRPGQVVLSLTGRVVADNQSVSLTVELSP